MCDSSKVLPCCFVCRQVINEFFAKEHEVILYSNDGDRETYLVKDLCPFPFEGSSLK